MQRSLLTSFAVLALIIGAAGAAPAAHAQYDSSQNIEAALNQTAATAANSVSDPAAAKARNDYTPDSTDSAYNTVMIKIMTLFAWLVGVAAIVLDYAVYYTVVTMGTYVNNLSAIGVTWSILRDIGNIFLIFGFLAVGITTILNVDWYGGGKKMLPMMFVAAIFLNFSFFITEAVIDTGNLFATQFYTQINGGNPAGIKDFDPGSIYTSNEGISGKIMSQLGLQTIFGNALDPDKAKFLFTGANQWFVGFMGVILFIVTAFVLFSLAFVLIARFVILIFLIILAPVGFAGLAVPQLASMAKKWWDKLFEQTITAPVLLLMLYIALTVITDVRFLTGFGADRDWTGFVNNSNLVGFASMMLSFLVAMGLLLAVVIFAKNLSAFGADKASALAGKLTFGATAWGMRSTVGAGSQRMSQFVRRKFGSTKTGRVIASTFDLGAKGSFDIRGVTALGGLKATGIDAGKVEEGGYRKHREDVIKGHTEYSKSVATAIDDAREVTDKDRADDAKNKRDARNAVTTATQVQQPIKQIVAQQKAEVARLQRQVDAAVQRGTTDPRAEADLARAQGQLDINQERLSDATAELKKATETLEKVSKQTADDVSKDRTKKEAEQAQRAYAGNITNSLPGWVVYGPGGNAAAKKIIKDVSKSEKDKILEAIQAAMHTPPATGGGAAPSTPIPPASAPVAGHSAGTNHP